MSLPLMTSVKSILISALGLLICYDVAFSQMMAQTTTVSGSDRKSAGAALVLSSTDYDLVGTEEVDRKIIAGELAFGLMPHADLFAQLGYIFDASIDTARTDVEGDGGFVLGVGGRFLAHQDNLLRVYTYGLLNFTNEDYESGNTTIEVSLTELHLGAMVGFRTNNRIMPYAGAELIPFSDGKFKAGGSSEEIERDDVLLLRLGASLALSNATLRADIALLGETTITLGASTSL